MQNTLTWITSVLAMGPEAAQSVNLPAAARFLGDALAVPSDLIRTELLQAALATPPRQPEQKQKD